MGSSLRNKLRRIEERVCSSLFSVNCCKSFAKTLHCLSIKSHQKASPVDVGCVIHGTVEPRKSLLVLWLIRFLVYVHQTCFLDLVNSSSFMIWSFQVSIIKLSILYWSVQDPEQCLGVISRSNHYSFYTHSEASFLKNRISTNNEIQSW